MKTRRSYATILGRIVLAIFILLALILLYEVLYRPTTDFRQSYYTLLIIGFGIAAVCMAAGMIARWEFLKPRIQAICNSRWILWVAVGLCLVVKLGWVLCIRIDPRVDYFTFYRTAENLSQHFHYPADPGYVALFPHIYGYASFLSLIFAITGASPLVAAIVNALLSVLSMVLLHWICKQLFTNVVALLASLLWILLPSQTIYNMFVLSEPYYTTMLLAVFALLIWVDQRLQGVSYPRVVLFAIPIAILMSFVNAARPIGAILLIALAIWLFILKGAAHCKVITRKRILYFAIILIVYLTAGKMHDAIFTARMGVEPATIPGYNIYVGFNPSSKGTWNQADSDLLFYYTDDIGLSAKDAQNQMLHEAMKRITQEDIPFASLFYDKYLILWQNDTAAIEYGQDVIPHFFILKVLSNAFYYLLWFFALLGAIAAWRKRTQSGLMVIVLFFLGLTFAQLLVEVAGRYHYSGLVSLVILAAYGMRQTGKYLPKWFSRTGPSKT